MKTNWQTKKLGEVCEISAGSPAPNPSEIIEDGNYNFFRTSDVGKIHIGSISDARDKINEDTASGLKHFPEGTLLFPKSGASTFLNHRVLMDVDGYVSSHLATIKAKEKIILDKFLFYYSILIDSKSLMQDQSYPSLRLSDINNIKINVPSLEEQKQIVKILDEVFESISKSKENAEKNLKNAKELFESYLEEIFSNPKEDWEEKKLGEVCELINRGISPKYAKSEGLCVLNQKCIREHQINFELSRLHNETLKRVNPERLIQNGDVLVNSTGTGTLGRVAQVRENPIKATVDSHVTIVRPIKNKFYEPFFGYGLIFLEKEISLMGAGCGGQTELARNTLKEDFKLSFPKSLKEQTAIVQKLDSLSVEIKQLEQIYKQKLKDLEELKKSMLQKAFSGELTKE